MVQDLQGSGCGANPTISSTLNTYLLLDTEYLLLLDGPTEGFKRILVFPN